MTLILASGSPRRRELLGQLGLSFEVVPSKVEERPPHPEENPSAYALELARAKVTEVAQRFPDAIILGADTVVVVDDTILGKPTDPEDALCMLDLLRNRWHHVVTAVVVCCSGRELQGTASAQVHMRDFSDEEACAYVASGEPADKAGAYAVQGLGGHLVDEVSGCYTAVVGLPLYLSAKLLRKCGLLPSRSTSACHSEGDSPRGSE